MTRRYGLGLAIGGLAAFALAGATLAFSGPTNGSFENGTYVDGGSGFQTVTAGDTSIDGWTVDAGSVDWIGTHWTAQDGAMSIDMSGTDAGTISQTFATTIGNTYTVSFFLPATRQDPPAVKTLDVSATGGTPASYTFDTTGATLSNMNWAGDLLVPRDECEHDAQLHQHHGGPIRSCTRQRRGDRDRSDEIRLQAGRLADDDRWLRQHLQEPGRLRQLLRHEGQEPGRRTGGDRRERRSHRLRTEEHTRQAIAHAARDGHYSPRNAEPRRHREDEEPDRTVTVTVTDRSRTTRNERLTLQAVTQRPGPRARVVGCPPSNNDAWPDCPSPDRPVSGRDRWLCANTRGRTGAAVPGRQRGPRPESMAARQRSRASASPNCRGAPGRTRTADAHLRTVPLYPLSYGGAAGIVPVPERNDSPTDRRHERKAAVPPNGGLSQHSRGSLPTAAAAPATIAARWPRLPCPTCILYTRPGCGLCDETREHPDVAPR